MFLNLQAKITARFPDLSIDVKDLNVILNLEDSGMCFCRYNDGDSQPFYGLPRVSCELAEKLAVIGPMVREEDRWCDKLLETMESVHYLGPQAKSVVVHFTGIEVESPGGLLYHFRYSRLGEVRPWKVSCGGISRLDWLRDPGDQEFIKTVIKETRRALRYLTVE